MLACITVVSPTSTEHTALLLYDFLVKGFTQALFLLERERERYPKQQRVAGGLTTPSPPEQWHNTSDNGDVRFTSRMAGGVQQNREGKGPMTATTANRQTRGGRRFRPLTVQAGDLSRRRTYASPNDTRLRTNHQIICTHVVSQKVVEVRHHHEGPGE